VELKYTDPSAGAAAQYNGNMAEMLWRRSGSWVGYKFGYDGADRLLAAEGIAGNNYKVTFIYSARSSHFFSKEKTGKRQQINRAGT